MENILNQNPEMTGKEKLTVTEVLNEVLKERIKQHSKWGEQNHPCLDQVLLNRNGSCTPQRMCMEYEIPNEKRAKDMCDIAFKREQGTWAHIAVEEMSEVVSAFDIHKRREELIQLAAVCVAWVEKIDRDISNLNE